MNELEQFLSLHSINYSVISENVVLIGDETYELIIPINDRLFDNNFHLVYEHTEYDNYIFRFGGRWYFTPAGSEKRPRLNRVRFLGECVQDFTTESFLGIHGLYEVLNGTGHYTEWCKKAKFLDVKVLGICEKNTLAGVLRFQIECKQNGIRSIIGATYTIYRQSEDYRYDVKCYVKDSVGWENLLLINREVNVINQKYITEEQFLKLTTGLIIVLDPKSISWEKISLYQYRDLDLFYQLDTVEFLDNEYDTWYLNNLKKFVDSSLRPVSITDAFYLDREDSDLKVRLNQISSVFEYKSNNQFFKSKSEYFNELDRLFSDDERLFLFFELSIKNELLITDKCQFSINQSGKHLPVYKMSKEQQLQFTSNEELFWSLIERGIEDRVPKNRYEEYLDRVQEEISVIQLGHLLDYFLILWDIIQWSNRNGILTGVGRGSAGGSLVAYLLRITHIDPIKFDLLFERFLNKGRVEGGSMPDVDVDFSGERRDEVKRYMEQKYGLYQVFSVGTYNTLKLKSALKDLGKLYNLEIQNLEYITSAIDDSDGKYSENDVELLFQNACRSKIIYSFIQENSGLVNDLILLINHPKTQSIHACATVILPEERDVFHWIPVKCMLMGDGETCLVSEWEGSELESIGLLKEDILGVRQLDKFQFIVKLIKENRSKDINIYNLEYDDERVYQYFCNGWNQDVFHFGAKGLTLYCKQSKPSTINDLISAISLYRPGPIESNLHNEYILRKEGKKTVEYFWGTEKITESTYGILIYQEQIMKICVEIGGFSLVEADDIRKALGKMNKKYSDPYKLKFIKGAVERGCPRSESETLWTMMENFSKYGFNRAHGAAYTITGYICQWLKVHYPLEFWTSAFQYIDSSKREERMSQFIAEINKTGTIKISSVDINYSVVDVLSDYKTNTIYWSLLSIKQLGTIAVEQIITDRTVKGRYFSLEEFVDRHSFKGTKINKLHIENLIYTGAFDKIEEIKSPLERMKLIQLYRSKKKVVVDTNKDVFSLAGNLVFKDWWWDLQQKLLSGIALFDYETLTDEYIKDGSLYIDQSKFQSNVQNYYYCTGGYVLEVIERKSQKKGNYCSILIESNYEYVWVSVFPDHYKKLVDSGVDFINMKGKIIVFSGLIKFDDFKKENVFKIWDNSTIVILENNL